VHILAGELVDNAKEALGRATPPPGKIPSSTAAHVALSTSSYLSSSHPPPPPTLITPIHILRYNNQPPRPCSSLERSATSRSSSRPATQLILKLNSLALHVCHERRADEPAIEPHPFGDLDLTSIEQPSLTVITPLY